jgi:hypothetical protein
VSPPATSWRADGASGGASTRSSTAAGTSRSSRSQWTYVRLTVSTVSPGASRESPRGRGGPNEGVADAREVSPSRPGRASNQWNPSVGSAPPSIKHRGGKDPSPVAPVTTRPSPPPVADRLKGLRTSAETANGQGTEATSEGRKPPHGIAHRAEPSDSRCRSRSGPYSSAEMGAYRALTRLLPSVSPRASKRASSWAKWIPPGRPVTEQLPGRQ